jgi:hypothetical protein
MPRVALLLSATIVTADLLPAGSRSSSDFTLAYTGRDTYVIVNKYLHMGVAKAPLCNSELSVSHLTEGFETLRVLIK